ncbi:alkaline ceramidase [Venatoribacter cucullus]|uniref:Neutral ceramidase n=1 Tax=Venatoribacter cucullus TaxID=2661630 RepID=A0A9X7UYF4_9GAMM|nr:neutral/alkaline non-lysosomal ceramidase N-terminal domain-containing protein [Venatoribacter cucullus]QQD23426.1 alkaline ceramidase [Venatoribacter cucullus]
MRLLCSLLALVSLTACANTRTLDINQPLPAAPPLSQYAEAGAVSVDITPPPGMPMGGYSVMANRGQGFRTRIKARVVYLHDGKGQAMALVQTDLTAASLLLQHAVAARVAETTGLKPADIAITASHSHSAPVNFFDNDFYNKHMSSGQWLEPEFLEFATARISAGIIDAFNSRRPAKIATGKKDIYGYNRNRSLDSWALNHNVGEVDLDDSQQKFRAVNPSLYMVRVDVKDDDGAFKPLAAFSSFSVHATALTVPVEVYNADLFAYAQKDLEWTIRDRYNTPWPVVHALSTGTQGDMAPALPEQGDNTFGHHHVDWKAAKQLGQGIGREAIELFEDLGRELTAEVSLASAARELNIREHHQAGEVAICQDAAVGNPVAAGAFERRTPFLAAIPFFKGGNVMARRWWFFNEGCQGNKRHLGFSFLQPLLEPKDSFPNTVLFQLLRINDMLILPLPFETTTEAGRRISQRVQDAFNAAGQPLRYVWVASNANGYFGYTTTPEEYSRQNYEGGHTLYGQYSTPYLAEQLGILAQDFLQQGPLQELKPEWRYALKVNSFLPPESVSSGQRRWLQAPLAVAAEDTHEEDYIAVRWLDVGPRQIDFHQPLVRIEQRHGDQWQLLHNAGEPVHDDGYDIEVRYLKTHKDDGMAHYETRWYNPVAGGEYRFVIAGRAGQPALYSAPFHWQAGQQPVPDMAHSGQ